MNPLIAICRRLKKADMMFRILSFTLCIRSAPKGEFNSTVKSQNHTASSDKMISE